MSDNKTIDPNVIKEEILSKYPPKVARKRAKQFVVNKVEENDQVPQINANVRTVPGYYHHERMLLCRL